MSLQMAKDESSSTVAPPSPEEGDDDIEQQDYSEKWIGEDSLFDKISERGRQLYGTPGQKLWEELALSAASYGLYRSLGRKVEGVRILRHPLVYGKNGIMKSEMIRQFRRDVLSGEVGHTTISEASDEALVGGWDGENDKPIKPKLMRNNFTQVEWDTLSTGDSENKMGSFYKGLEEGILSRDLMSVARSDNSLDDDELDDNIGSDEIQLNGTEIRFPVKSAIIGVVHEESNFWKKFDKAFYNRWVPVHIQQPEMFKDQSYKLYVREHSGMLDEDTSELKTLYKENIYHNNLDLDGFIDDPMKPVPLYGNKVDELLGVGKDSSHSEGMEFRITNAMKTTLACKALLEGQIDDGELYYTDQDYMWLLDRIEEQYKPDLYDMRTRAVTDADNLGAIKTSWTRYKNTERILELIYENDGISREEISNEIDVPESTVKNYLSNEWVKKLTEKKRRPVNDEMVTFWHPAE